MYTFMNREEGDGIRFLTTLIILINTNMMKLVDFFGFGVYKYNLTLN